MSKRDYFFDNAKFILIFLVVFGHAIQPYIAEDPLLLSLYKTIYFFHMPAFILVAGYFAKGIHEKGHIRKLVKKLIIPYLIFQTIYTIYYYFLRNEQSLVVDPFNPQWSLWFLVSMFFWSLLLILFVDVLKLSWKTALPLSIALGLLIGFVNDFSQILSISRTFVFFPFFLLGYYAKRNHIYALKRKPFRLAAFFSLTVVLLFMMLLPNWSTQWLLGSHSYENIGAAVEISPFIRMTIYAINVWLVASFFSLVPDKKYFYTKWGKNTLYVYLLHGFIIQLFRENLIDIVIHPYVSLVLIMAASWVLTIILSTNWITAVAQPLIELKANRLKKL
ncbi:acyltransferase family protein [Jeotgalibacillus proteolyticus]|uniref:Acyltransferase n=1 Tax=Jeotgalibacillus proteolyticus TaxID=2082395 RepID=A0A2S5GGZ6_9BACL|nr:acyltransferase family protein [Jeotgalibacillus proteolyticus]PPA72246.1 acyltransferase [Jeotgalibacillus proteolyticus]